MQRILNFLDIPIPETQVWETMENEQRTVAIEVLARLIAHWHNPADEQVPVLRNANWDHGLDIQNVLVR